MKSYLECWITVATALFSQALAGEPELAESLPKPLAAGAFGFAATISGEVEGRFAVVLDPSILESPLVGEGVDQKAGWGEILKEVADAAAGELLAQTGKKCHVVAFEEIAEESKVSCAFQLKSGENLWTILVRDEVRAPKPAAQPPVHPEEAQPSVSPEAQGFAPPAAAPPVAAPASTAPLASDYSPAQAPPPALSAGVELLLDVELEAALRFGCKELPLGEILDLGPGDVVQLDRNVADPVDLIVGDKIVARGEVVLVNGNFGLRVTEVAAPRKRLESIRCLF
jgi:flagellar motor switch protein FliN